MIHFGFVGLMGLPNAGKSSFLNYLLKEKLSIVSNLPQSTRRSFKGLFTHKNFQIVFFDTPGFVPSEKNKVGVLTDFLISEFDKVVKKSDHLFFLISHSQKESVPFHQMLKKIENCKKPVSFLFTKSDLKISKFVSSYKTKIKKEGKNYIETSIKDKKPEKLIRFIKKAAENLPTVEEGFPYNPDLLSLDSTSDIISEFVREQCFLQLKKEIPFGLGVIVRSIKNEKNMKHIQMTIIVEKENHKAIVIGRGGQQLKKIGQKSREKIENLLGKKVFLKLHVSFKKKWTKNPNIMKELGYAHDKG